MKVSAKYPKTTKLKKFIPKRHPQCNNVQPPPVFDFKTLKWAGRPRRKQGPRRFAPLEKPGTTSLSYKTSPGDMFKSFFDEPGEFWRQQSNAKLKELTELFNQQNPEKKKKLYQITKNDAKAAITAILHMGSNCKTNYKEYWSQNDNRKDPFIEKLIKYSKLSARRFRQILNCIRLYSKEDATKNGWNNRKSEAYDEHFRVSLFVSL